MNTQQLEIKQSNKTGKITTAVIGASGYTGQELVRILAQHPDVQLQAVTSQSYGGIDLADVFPHLRGHLQINCAETDIAQIADECDAVFVALPHGIASNLITAAITKKTKVIDLGADFRLKNIATYEKWYHAQHGNAELLGEAVYGLAEWNEAAIRKTNLVANPGCYATAAALALLPLVKSGLIEPSSIVVDGKSGVSGAGRAASQAVHYNECNETIKAYGVTTHRHTPEIEEQLAKHFSGNADNVKITFTPHLVPMNRGILITAYSSLTRQCSLDDLYSVFNECYAEKPFVRVYTPKKVAKGLPETRWVKGSNYCDIGYAIDERTERVIVVAALDNLVKGAAGQAVQNMNIMYGLDQRRGLTHVPLFPA
jgi:N-acetyl-gamma-glutamyl-phosphate reductase